MTPLMREGVEVKELKKKWRESSIDEEKKFTYWENNKWLV